ncbi:MAG: hypothetical protein A2Y69_14610 [Candidatus Aminicenantes bacterium RBG_13_59_9]|nr:MAG: hypothetical protein A2Y69_14610 [Candidatus Aminicenantes bacterium RBG_13_59_9]
MSNTLALIIQLVSGALGGNGAGAILKKLSLGTIFNSIVGILGGGLGGWLMKLLNISIGSGGADIGSILGNVAAGGVGGGVLMVIIGGIKKLISK